MRAKEEAKRVVRRIVELGAVPPGTGLTANEWFGKYYDAAQKGIVGRKNRGRPQASVEDRRARFRRWISDDLGMLSMTAVKAEHLRRLVQKLDEQVLVRTRFYAEQEDATESHKGRKPGISAKTAANVWGEITSGFAEATNSKIDELRVLEVNPAIGVRPPTTTDDREQAALFSDEVMMLLGCREVPRARRRVDFVAIYTGMRRSELERFTAGDVDLEHDLITVRGKKSNAARRQVPIAPALRPAIVVMIAHARTMLAKKDPTMSEADVAEALSAYPLLAVPRADGKGGAADLTRKDLERAKLTRADLFRDDAEHMPFTFHGMRHTAITHWAVAGVDQRTLLLISGHTDTEMTLRYLDKAAVVRSRFGMPHPMLPDDVMADLLADLVADLLENEVGGKWASGRAAQKQTAQVDDLSRILTSLLATPAGIEPALPA